ncbi:hypothetical protein [Leeuwenhoekiella parthenopeia]|uniref:Uncharacterized protein n=1 Tax=Leeuwenhoekiella parthenopeia TaxID=2890320 RepID=A0ABS8GRV5_9FLAO|nr:hypothetical protein [Leeuwenhoekiella parthenopeia]MCC4212705.1 hypothetical protein [Leeuwenhoekiella parthenopeia]
MKIQDFPNIISRVSGCPEISGVEAQSRNHTRNSKFKVILTDKEKSHQPVNYTGMTDAISQSLKKLLRNDN